MTLVADWNASINVPFQRMRQMQLDGVLQEGVVGASDLMVVQRGAGANQSVDVGAGFAWVQIDTGTRNGMGHVTNDATANVALTAANGTNPRIDQIILRWNDSIIPTGSGNVPTLEVLTGTATSGATLANRTGATALPNDCLRLADVLVPTSSTTVSNTQIRDRRPWARGAYFTLQQPATSDLTFSGTSPSELHTWTVPRIECSGAPLVITYGASVSGSSSSGNLFVQPAMDGAVVSATLPRVATVAATAVFIAIGEVWGFAPAAGSHLFSVWMHVGSGNAVLYRGTGAAAPQMTIREVVRPNSANNTTTSG